MIGDIVYIHGRTKAKILKELGLSVLVEYLENSYRISKGTQKKIINVNIRKQRQFFNKKNGLVRYPTVNQQKKYGDKENENNKIQNSI